jgi:hypothetical protein
MSLNLKLIKKSLTNCFTAPSILLVNTILSLFCIKLEIQDLFLKLSSQTVHGRMIHMIFCVLNNTSKHYLSLFLISALG